MSSSYWDISFVKTAFEMYISDKSENDLKALQSVGQIVGEVGISIRVKNSKVECCCCRFCAS